VPKVIKTHQFTLIPFCTNFFAIAKPIPEAPPVITSKINRKQSNIQ